jgi:hypothetical protein
LYRDRKGDSCIVQKEKQYTKQYTKTQNTQNIKHTEQGRCCGMEINVEKGKVMRISRQTSPVTIMINQTQLESVECFKYLGSMLTNDGRCTCGIKCRIVMAKAAFNPLNAELNPICHLLALAVAHHFVDFSRLRVNNKKNPFISTLDLELRKKLVKCYIWSIALCGAETGTVRGSRSEEHTSELQSPK